MRTSPLALFALIAAALLSSRCSENSFSGSASSAAQAPGASTTTPAAPNTGNPAVGDPVPAPPDANCIKGDMVNIPLSGPAKGCFDSGRTWNFGANKCQDIRKAKFECTWDNVIKWFSTTNLLPTDAIKNGQRDGRKVVSCGESEDGNRLVVIWLNPPQSGTIQCDNPKSLEGRAVTGCYTFYPNPAMAPPDTADEAVKRQRVYACMDSL